MATGPAPSPRAGGWGTRLLALLPILLLIGVAAGYVASGSTITDLIGSDPPPADEVEIRRVEFHPGEIRVLVRNPQADDITVAVVTVDDAVVPFTTDGPDTIGRLRSTTIEIPYTWVEDDPYTVGVTSSTGIQTTFAVPAAVATPGLDGGSVGGYALLGFLVGVVPVALGMLWLPALRSAGDQWLALFMAVTAGLLSFLAVDALFEALELQAALPGALGGPGLVLIGVAVSYLGLSWVAQRLSRRGAGGAVGVPLAGVGLATMVAIGIGLHNLGEGLAIGSSFAVGQLALGSFLVMGFMVHNVTEGLGIVAPIADGARVRRSRLAVLALVAGAPAILGAWIGGFLVNDVLAVLFFAVAVGAAAQVVVEVLRHLRRRAPGGLGSGWVVGGFLAGVVVMYLTGLLIG
jgi:zinc transporter, ZIP family